MSALYAYIKGKTDALYLGKTATATDSSKLGGTAAASYALLASPALTGTPTAPTAANKTNSTQIATTEFVWNNVARHILADTTIFVSSTAAGTKDGSSAANAMSISDFQVYVAAAKVNYSATSLSVPRTLTVKFVPTGSSYGDFYIDSSMKYIQFFYVYDNDTDEIAWARACISDPKDFPELDYGVEIEPLHFYDSCTELYSKMEYLSKSEFKEINSNNYPENFSKYGNVNKVYACGFNDGTIADEYNNEQRYYETYYVDYSSFNDVAMKAYKFAKNRGYHFCTKPEKYCVDGKFFMIYRKINVDDAYEINCDFYTPEEPRNSYGISDQYTVCNGTYPDFYAFLVSGAYSQ